jgi:hypothetical protein
MKGEAGCPCVAEETLMRARSRRDGVDARAGLSDGSPALSTLPRDRRDVRRPLLLGHGDQEMMLIVEKLGSLMCWLFASGGGGGVLHLVVGCFLFVNRSPVVESSKHYNSEPTIY